MKKRSILLVFTALLAMCMLTSCAMLREPWPASEGYENTVTETPEATELPPQGDGPSATPAPTSNPVADPDYNG